MAEPALDEKVGWLEGILQASPDALMFLDGDRITACNAAACTLFGAKPGSLEGGDVRGLLPKGLPDQDVGGGGPGVDVAAVVADGAATLELTTRRVRTADGPRRLVALRDATHRTEAKEELAKREKRFQEAQEVAHIGSWEWDIPADHVTWTDELYRLYGLEPQCEYIDYPRYLSLLHPEDRDMADGVVQAAFQEFGPFAFQHRLILPDGAVRWLQGRGEVFTDDGKPVRMVGTAQDITDQKEAQRIVAESLREKEVLLKEVHHRVKNNLQVVSSLLRIQGRKAADPVLLEQLSESRRRIRSMALVHEKLYRSEDLARLDSSDYLRDLVAEVRRSISAPAGVQVETDVASFPLDLDRAVTLGLLANELVSNAFKHAFPDGHGTIHVHAHADDGRLVLEVRDDGIGLPDGFDPAASDTLGMRLVQSLVHQMDGELTVRSDSGASFRVEAGAP